MSANYSDYYEFEEEEADLSSSTNCEMYAGFQGGLLLYSILILFIYMCMQKRVRWRPNVLYGHFGIPIPINLVHETKDRWAYAAVFGALSGTFVQLIFDGNLVSPQGFVDSILKGFILFLTMLFIPLLFFALIASVHGKVQLLTQAVGLTYVITAVIQQILVCIDCHEATSEITPKIYRIIQYVHLYGSVIPILLCNILAGLYFTIRGIQAFVSIIIGKPFTSQQDIRHHFGYVKQLFTRKSYDEPPKPKGKLWQLLDRFLYKRDPYFKYPIRVMCITSVVVVGLLVLNVQLLSFLVTLVRFSEDMLAEASGVDVIQRVTDVAYAFAVIIPVVSYCIAVVSFLLSIVAYRKDCKRVQKGDHSFLPSASANTLVRSTFYVGWQIGMVMWAWLFYVAIMLLLVMAIVVIVLALVYIPEIREWVIRRVILLASTAITGLLFTFVQLLIARCVFAEGKSLIVNNSRLFHLYTYVFLFYNALIGVGKAIRRIFTSAVINLFFLPRLDRSLLVQGLSNLDKGYIAYLSAVRVDAAYNNPVMNVFVYLLTQVEKKTSIKSNSILSRFTIQDYYQDMQSNAVNPLSDNEYKLSRLNKLTSSKARKMWYLAYTLVRNPDLIELRRGGNEYKSIASVFSKQKSSKFSVFGTVKELANDDIFNQDESSKNSV